MKADLNLATPTTKQQVLDGLVIIDEYYRKRKDEYVPPVLIPLNFDKVEFVQKTDEQYLAEATLSLKPKHLDDIMKRKDAFNKDLHEINYKILQLPIEMAEEIAVCEQSYDDEIASLKEELRLKGVAYGDGASSAVAVLTAEKNNAINKIRAKYEEKQTNLESLANYYSSERDGAENYFTTLHAEEINATVFELKEKDVEKQNELLQYNENLKEREIKYNNTIEQAQKKLHLEYMKIVYQGMTDEELLQKGYYRDVVDWVIDYYIAMTNKEQAYKEYTSTTEYIVYLKDFYEQGVRLLYALAYGA